MAIKGCPKKLAIPCTIYSHFKVLWNNNKALILQNCPGGEKKTTQKWLVSCPRKAVCKKKVRHHERQIAWKVQQLRIFWNVSHKKMVFDSPATWFILHSFQKYRFSNLNHTLCSKNIQNVKLRLDFVKIWSFYCYSNFT